MGMYVTPALFYRSQSSTTTCSVSGKHFVIGIGEMVHAMHLVSSSQALKVVFEASPDQFFPAANGSAALGMFTMQVEAFRIARGSMKVHLCKFLIALPVSPTLGFCCPPYVATRSPFRRRAERFLGWNSCSMSAH